MKHFHIHNFISHHLGITPTFKRYKIEYNIERHCIWASQYPCKTLDTLYIYFILSKQHSQTAAFAVFHLRHCTKNCVHILKKGISYICNPETRIDDQTVNDMARKRVRNQ